MRFPLYLLICVGLALVLTNCGVPGIPRPPSLDLPQPVSDLRAVRKGERVYLTWTVPDMTTDGVRMRMLGITRICRPLDAATRECTNPVGTVKPPQAIEKTNGKTAVSNDKIRANYADQLSPAILSNNPATQFFYAVSVLNQNGRSAGLSNKVAVPAIIALPPPSDLRGAATATGIILGWSGVAHPAETPELRHFYRVYRRESDAKVDSVVGEVPLDTAPTYSLVDHSFDWEKTYEYRATVNQVMREEARTEEQFEGADSAPVRVFAHDIFPPAVPGGLQAVSSAPGQQPFIDLIWTPDTDPDLAGYNVLRHEVGTSAQKINPELIKTPAFRDSNVLPGHTYFYAVSAVDVRGNESVPSVEASETVH
jgi:hypothetical protein